MINPRCDRKIRYLILILLVISPSGGFGNESDEIPLFINL
jgi:hypothetical protein